MKHLLTVLALCTLWALTACGPILVDDDDDDSATDDDDDDSAVGDDDDAAGEVCVGSLAIACGA